MDVTISVGRNERDSLRQREERRHAIDAAISTFVRESKACCKTVGQSAVAMKSQQRRC